MRKALVSVVTALLLMSAASAFAEYDHQKTVATMRSNLVSLSAAKAASANGDFYAAAEALMTIGQNALMLSAMDPPKGSKEVWTATQKELARAAFKGIGACGAGDKAALDAALDEIVAVRGKGHSTFRG